MVSVIIPAYNASTTITRALDSVKAQTLQPSEVIIVNDGSSDNTSAVIQNYIKSTALNIILVETKNGGPSQARNIAIERAKGNWLAFLDADDIWNNSDKLLFQSRLVEKYPDTILVDTFSEVYWNDTKTNINDTVKNDNAFELLLTKNIINATSSVLSRVDSVKLAGGFNTEIKFGEDRLLWAKLALQGRFRTVEKLCVFKENHDANLTSNGMMNLKYREMLVEELLNLKVFSKKETKTIWLLNFEEFLKKALKKRCFNLYNLIASSAFKKSGSKFIMSKYFLFWLPSLVLSVFTNK